MFVFFFCSLDRLRHLTTVSVWVTSRAWAGNFFFFLIFNFLPCDKESSVWVWTENWAGRKSKQMTVQRSGLRAPPSGSLLSQQQQAIRRTGSSVQMWKKIQSDNPGLLVWVLIWFRELIHVVNIPVAAAEHRGVVLRTRSRIFFFFTHNPQLLRVCCRQGPSRSSVGPNVCQESQWTHDWATCKQDRKWVRRRQEVPVSVVKVRGQTASVCSDQSVIKSLNVGW